MKELWIYISFIIILIVSRIAWQEHLLGANFIPITLAWPIFCATITGIYTKFVLKSLNGKSNVLFDIYKISFALILPVGAGFLISLYHSPTQNLYVLLSVGLYFVYLPSLILSIITYFVFYLFKLKVCREKSD